MIYMNYCDNYCGVNCVNGHCPASIDDFEDMDCSECIYYNGCDDCGFFEECGIFTNDRRKEKIQ